MAALKLKAIAAMRHKEQLTHFHKRGLNVDREKFKVPLILFLRCKKTYYGCSRIKINIS
jgi:hypothetical protein